MYSNVWHCLVLSSLSWVVLLMDGVRAQGMNLGKLHWCDTLCLCHDDTMEKMHCFESLDIYSLLEVDIRKVQRLSRAGFQLEEKLMWCSETCLCHKVGKKEFKCTSKVHLGEFINERAPFLSHYLEPDVEIFDVRDTVEEEGSPPVEGAEEDEEAEKKDRHERRKNRKHRKNRKKIHRDRKQEGEAEEEEHDEQLAGTMTPTAPSVDALTVEPEERREVHSAGIFSQGSLDNHETPSSKMKEGGSQIPVLEVPLERKTVAGEVANELQELRDNVDHIKEDVTFNQHILLVTVVVAAIAMIGVLILAFYLCCIRKSSKKLPNSPKNSSLRQEENNVTKVNLDEAW